MAPRIFAVVRTSSGIHLKAKASRAVVAGRSALARAGRFKANAKRSSKLMRSGFEGNAAEAVGRLESVSQAATTSDTQIAAVTNRIVLGHPRRGDSRPALAACKAIEPPIPPRRCRTPIPHGSVDVSRIRQLVPKVRHNRDEDHGSPQDLRCLRAAKNARFAPSRCLPRLIRVLPTRRALNPGFIPAWKASSIPR